MESRQSTKIPILTYHSIDASKSVVSTAPETFRRQMRFLRENNYRVVSLEKLVAKLDSKEHLPPKSLALTFDDGFQNFYTTAFPVLAEYEFPATVFLVTNYCGKHNDWAGNPLGLPRSRLLSWPEIKELNSYRIEFGAHTETHPDLTRIPLLQVEQEITRSKTMIENQLGRAIATFAYPYGRFNRTVRQIIAAKFGSACSTNLGKAHISSDVFALERIDSYYLSNLAVFNCLATKTFDSYLRFRQTLRSFKTYFQAH